MKLGIVTDSTCDLPGNLTDEHGIEVVPCVLILDGKEYMDGRGISREDFYRRLPTFQRPPTTAAPSLGEFTQRYEKLLTAGCEHVLSIHAAGPLTAILGTAQQAAKEFPGRITTLDSRSLTLGLGFQVLAAAEMAEQGLEAALSAVDSTRRRVNVFAALDTLAYVRRSGRPVAAMAAVGTLLSVKPLIELTDAQVKVAGVVRTTQQANQRMLGFLRQCGQVERLAVLHTSAEPRAREFLQNVMMEMNRSMPHEILLVNVTTVIGTHVGPNGLGFAAVRAL